MPQLQPRVSAEAQYCFSASGFVVYFHSYLVQMPADGIVIGINMYRKDLRCYDKMYVWLSSGCGLKIPMNI